MNFNKTYLNAPAPLFAKLLDEKDRDVGIEEILCVAAERLCREKHYTLEQCCAEFGVNLLPTDAIHRGREIVEKFRGCKYLGIERKQMCDFINEYKTNEEYALLVGYLTIKRIVGRLPFIHATMNKILSLMSGNKDEYGIIHPSLQRYLTKRGRKHFTSLLTKYYGVRFYTKTRGYFVSLALSEEEIAEKLGKKASVTIIASAAPGFDYQAVISEKDSEIENLKAKVLELESKIAELTKKPIREKFSKEVNIKAKNVFLDFYKRHVSTVSYYWESKDSGQMTNLLKKLKFVRKENGMVCTDEELISDFQTFLENINDDWILKHLSVGIVNSKFNELLSGARNNYSRKKHAQDYEVSGEDSGAYNNENLEGWS